MTECSFCIFSVICLCLPTFYTRKLFMHKTIVQSNAIYPCQTGYNLEFLVFTATADQAATDN